MFSKKFRGDCLRYCFGGNPRYSLVGRFGGKLGGNFWGNFGGNLGEKLGGDLWGKPWMQTLDRKKSYLKKRFLGIPTLDKLMIIMK